MIKYLRLPTCYSLVLRTRGVLATQAIKYMDSAPYPAQGARRTGDYFLFARLAKTLKNPVASH